MKNIQIYLEILLICLSSIVYSQNIRPIFPENEQMIFTDTAHFHWNTYLNTQTYHLQVATDTAFTQLLLNADVQETDTVISGLVPDNTYYWRIMPQGGTYGPCLKFIYFTPRMIPNLVGWYEADSCHLADTLNHIDTLYDKSGNNRHLIQNTMNKQPSYVNCDSIINNSPSIYFNGNNLLYSINNEVITSPNTYCFIWKNDSVLNNENTFLVYLCGKSVSQRNQIWMYKNQLGMYSGINEILNDTNIIKINQFNYSYFNARFNGNNTIMTMNNNAYWYGNAGNYSMRGLVLGAAYDMTTRCMKGNTPILLYYHGLLDTLQSQQIAQYISEKYYGRLNLGEYITTTSSSAKLQPNKEYVSYLWSTGDTTSSITVQQSGTYWLTTVNRFGWQETDTIDVFLNIPPVSDTLICYGDSVKWNMNYQYPYTYQWSNGQVGEQFTTDKEGEYHVILTDSLQRQIGLKFYVTTTNQTQTRISITPIDSLCNGNSITLTYPQETENFHVVWSTGDSNSLQTVFTQTGWYGVQVQDSIGCIGRDSIYVIKKGNAPLVSFTADNICMRDSTTFINTSTTDDGSTIMLSEWTLGDGQDYTPASALQGFKHLYDTAGMYRVSLHCVSSTGCEQEYAQTIAVYALPQPEFSPVTACEDAPVSFRNLTRSEYRVTDYIWYFAPEDSTSRIHPEHVFADTGMHQVLLVAKTVTGCVDSIRTPFYVKPAPQAEFSRTRPCVGDILYLNDITALPVEQKVINRHWTVNGNSLDGNTNHAQIPVQQPGNYHITLQLQYLNGCLSETEAEVKVAALPHAAFSVNNLCQYDTLHIQDASSAGTGNRLTYQWHYLGKVYNDTLPVIPADSAGTFALRLYVYDTNACADSAWQNITVTPSPKADFSYDYAPGGLYALRFTNLSRNADSYQWQFDLLGSSTEEHPDFDFGAEGSYEVSLTAANAGNCTNEQKIHIVLPAYYLEADLADFQLPARNGALTPQILVLNKSNRALPLLQYAFTYDNVTLYETDSLPLPAGEMRLYTFRTSIAKRNTADYACVHLYTPYDDLISPAPDAEKREKCLLLHSGNFVQAPYPNPAREQVQLCYGIQTPATIIWQLYNIHGQRIAHTQQTAGTGIHYQTIDIRPYPQGVYMLRVIIGDEVFEYKIVKK